MKVTLAYARVSSHDQKEDLKRQILVLESFCASHGWEFEILQDLGSGLNYNKRGLRTLIKEICSGKVNRLVITHKDRLLRFGAELIFSLCEQFGAEVIIIRGFCKTHEKTSLNFTKRISASFFYEFCKIFIEFFQKELFYCMTSRKNVGNSVNVVYNSSEKSLSNQLQKLVCG